jgi:hypothetical protein
MIVGLMAITGGVVASNSPWLVPIAFVKPPFECEGLHVLVIEDETARKSMTSKQIAAFEGADVRDWTDKNAKEFLVLDKDADKASMSKWTKDAWEVYEKAEGKKLPWVVLSNGKTGTSEAYPANPADAIALLSKYGVSK